MNCTYKKNYFRYELWINNCSRCVQYISEFVSDQFMQVNFYIRGPHGAGKVYCEMFKDQVDKQWKYTYLIVEIKSPSPSQMILESYMPAYNVDTK